MAQEYKSYNTEFTRHHGVQEYNMFAPEWLDTYWLVVGIINRIKACKGKVIEIQEFQHRNKLKRIQFTYWMP